MAHCLTAIKNIGATELLVGFSKNSIKLAPYLANHLVPVHFKIEFQTTDVTETYSWKILNLDSAIETLSVGVEDAAAKLFELSSREFDQSESFETPLIKTHIDLPTFKVLSKMLEATTRYDGKYDYEGFGIMANHTGIKSLYLYLYKLAIKLDVPSELNPELSYSPCFLPLNDTSKKMLKALNQIKSDSCAYGISDCGNQTETFVISKGAVSLVMNTYVYSPMVSGKLPSYDKFFDSPIEHLYTLPPLTTTQIANAPKKLNFFDYGDSTLKIQGIETKLDKVSIETKSDKVSIDDINSPIFTIGKAELKRALNVLNKHSPITLEVLQHFKSRMEYPPIRLKQNLITVIIAQC